jgi:hypothetical protein
VCVSSFLRTLPPLPSSPPFLPSSHFFSWQRGRAISRTKNNMVYNYLIISINMISSNSPGSISTLAFQHLHFNTCISTLAFQHLHFNTSSCAKIIYHVLNRNNKLFVKLNHYRDSYRYDALSLTHTRALSCSAQLGHAISLSPSLPLSLSPSLARSLTRQKAVHT